MAMQPLLTIAGSLGLVFSLVGCNELSDVVIDPTRPIISHNDDAGPQDSGTDARRLKDGRGDRRESDGDRPDTKRPMPDTSHCGDGVIDGNEDCDGSQLGGKTCSALGYYAGTLKCSSSCAFDTSSCNNCGNGALDTGESCEGAQLGGKTCVSQGFYGGTLACNADCTFNTSDCKYATCGDGFINGNEQCDKTDVGGETCTSRGYYGGTLACSSNCAFDISGCQRCGDGAVNGAEECDGAQLGGKTCASLGYYGGALACKAACTLDISGCQRCGDGVINGTEECDGAQLGGKTCKTVGFDSGTLACKSDCSFNVASCAKCGDGVCDPVNENCVTCGNDCLCDMHWTVKISYCGTTSGYLKLRDTAAGLAWPSSTTSWIYTCGSGYQTYTIKCTSGHKICYAAKSYPASGSCIYHWGLDLDGTHGCSACCYTCGDVTVTLTLGTTSPDYWVTGCP